MTIKAGTTFTHKFTLHPDDRHLPAKEARKAVMKVTRATKTRVYYTYESTVENRGHWWMPREYFLGEYFLGAHKP
jgi:hypothetical protein